MTNKINEIYDLINLQFNQVLEKTPNAKRWVVSFSGGLDSSVLLHALVRWRLNSARESLPEISALHVNHQLSKHAQEWALFCQSVCEQLEIPLQIESVCVDNSSGLGLEASARDARYAVYSEYLKAGDVLLQGHHAHDQIETLLLRLMRGAGLKGLRSIPQKRFVPLRCESFSELFPEHVYNAQEKEGIHLFRPLLNVSQELLREYARSCDLKWIEDESNFDTQFDRNYLRQKVVPLLEQRWPDTVAHVSKSLEWLNESYELCQALAMQDLESCDKKNDLWGSESICFKLFSQLDFTRKKNCLNRWMEDVFDLTLNRNQLDLLCADDFKKLELLEHDGFIYYLELFSNRLYCYAQSHFSKEAIQNDWECSLGEKISIQGVGIISVDSQGVKGEGKDLLNLEKFKVSFREGGERAHPSTRKHSQTIKKLFQEYEVPPWWRFRVPLVFYQDELCAVGDLWVEKKFQEKLPIKINWQRCS